MTEEDIYDPEYHQYWDLAKQHRVEADLEGYIPKPQIDFSKMTTEQKNQTKVTDTAPFAIYRDIVRIVRKAACPRCWLLERACMCYLIKPAFIPANIHYHFIVHYSEFSRTSNTVKLMVRSVQDACELVEQKSKGLPLSNTSIDADTIPSACGTAEMWFFGIEAHEKKLEKLLETSHDNIIVLFPSSTPPAITVDEYLKKRQERKLKKSVTAGGETVQTNPTKFPTHEDDIHVIVIDGTWKQANHIHNRVIDSLCLEKNLPPLTYVKIDPGSILENNKSLFDPLRSQTQPDRCCTLEASTALLKELGSNISLSGEPLLFNLRALVDSQLAQSAVNPIYNIIDTEQYKTICKKQISKEKGTRSSKIDDESLRYVAMTGCIREPREPKRNNDGTVTYSSSTRKPQWDSQGNRIDADVSQQNENQDLVENQPPLKKQNTSTDN